MMNGRKLRIMLDTMAKGQSLVFFTWDFFDVLQNPKTQNIIPNLKFQVLLKFWIPILSPNFLKKSPPIPPSALIHLLDTCKMVKILELGLFFLDLEVKYSFSSPKDSLLP